VAVLGVSVAVVVVLVLTVAVLVQVIVLDVVSAKHGAVGRAQVAHGATVSGRWGWLAVG
jgi:hypothetical protein